MLNGGAVSLDAYNVKLINDHGMLSATILICQCRICMILYQFALDSHRTGSKGREDGCCDKSLQAYLKATVQ